MTDNTQMPFRLGRLSVIPSHNEIVADKTRATLQPKVMAVLQHLARRYPDVVSNDELLDEVWKGRVVTFSSVQKSINFLRKAIAELDDSREYVVHYSKKGYALDLAPQFEPASSVTALHQWVSQKSVVRRALPVAIVVALALAATALWSQSRHTLVWANDHQTQFSRARAVTSDSSADTAVAPHSDNRHLAVVRQSDRRSDLIILDSNQNHWRVASSAGQWNSLAWSADGKFLAVVEREKAQSQNGYYGRAFYRQTLHVFELDLTAGQLLDKHRLSQWHGDIHSLSWLGSRAVELVARHGTSAITQRYRYHLDTQRLERIGELEFAQNPIASATHEKYTAIASRRDSAVAVHFLDDRQTRFQSFTLDARNLSLNWLPDGSGVLLADNDRQRWHLLYRNGKTVELEFDKRAEEVYRQPIYSADGQSIYFVKERPVQSLWRDDGRSEKSPVIDQANWNYLARYAPDGERLSYVSVRNNAHEVRVRDAQDGDRSLIALADRVEQLLWSRDGSLLVVAAGSQVHALSWDSGEERLVANLEPGSLPVWYDSSNDELLLKKAMGGVDNLWTLDPSSGEAVQRTVGAVAGTVSAPNGLFFQYADQEGLWQLTSSAVEPELINPSLPANSRLLAVHSGQLYFLTGTHCAESQLFAMRLNKESQPEPWAELPGREHTLTYSPGAGRIYHPCQRHQSDVLKLTNS